jgi:pimeloyl-ACP methyl ester carboxylesterase
MPFVDRDGVRIHYEDSGPATSGAPAILLTHGYASTARAWEPQVADLAPEFRLITWDMRGHGESDPPADPGAYSEEATVADMAAILDACNVSRAAIGGLSLGGFMSLAFHHAHPDRVALLLLFDTGPGYRSDDSREQWNERARRRGDRLDEQGMDAIRESNEVRHTWHPHGAAGLAHAARGMLTQRDGRIINSLPEIAVPALIVVGANDEAYLAGTEYMAGKIPGATRVVLADAGHSSNVDQPGAFNEAVRQFMRSRA